MSAREEEAQIPTRILIVEDNATAIDFFSKTLLDAGYQVVIAWNGSVALERAMRFQPDVIVLNARLDRVGDSTFRETYQRVCDPLPPIITAEIGSGWRLGDIQRPGTAFELLALVKRALATRGTSPENP